MRHPCDVHNCCVQFCRRLRKICHEHLHLCDVETNQRTQTTEHLGGNQRIDVAYTSSLSSEPEHRVAYFNKFIDDNIRNSSRFVYVCVCLNCYYLYLFLLSFSLAFFNEMCGEMEMTVDGMCSKWDGAHLEANPSAHTTLSDYQFGSSLLLFVKCFRN